MKKIYLITNDKIWFSGKRYTSNNDLNNIITSLNNDYNVNRYINCKDITIYKMEYTQSVINTKIVFKKIYPN